MSFHQSVEGTAGKLQAERIAPATIEGLIGADGQGNITFCNEAVLQMTGYQADELNERSLQTLLHDGESDGTKCSDGECPTRMDLDRQCQPYAIREFCWRKDRTSFPVEYWVHPLPKPFAPTAYVITIQAIAEREHAIADLPKSQEKFRRILASVPDVAWTSDHNGRTIYVSPKVESVLGYSKHELCAATATLRSGLIHPADFDRVNQAYRALFDTHGSFDEEYRIRRKDGVWIWIHDRATGIREENGALYADGAFSDITTRKEDEAELRWKTAFLEALVNSTIDGILVVDGNGKRLLHNQKFVEIFKIPQEVIADEDGRRRLNHVASLVKDAAPYLHRLEELYKDPSAVSRDEVELKDGMVVDRYSAPVVDNEGTYYGRIWTVRDITERKRNEDTLQQLSMAVEQSPVSVVITDPRGAISYVNLKFTEVTGYRTEEVLGKSSGIVKSGLTSADVYRDLWSTIKRGQEWRGEFCNKKKNGELFWEAAKIRPITDRKGQITHYVTIKEDITERRRAEEALRESEERYRSLFERNVVGVFQSTFDGRFLNCNQALANMLGFDSRQEALAHRVQDFYYSAEERAKFLEGLKAEGRLTDFEMRLRRKDGSPLWLIANVNPLSQAASGSRMIEGTFVDITRRKRVEQTLQEYEKAVEGSRDMIAVVDRDYRYLIANRAYLEPRDMGRAQVVGHLVSEVLGKEHFENSIRPKMDECFSGKIVRFEMRYQYSKMGERDLLATYFPVEGVGAVDRVVCVLQDITERRRAEEELRASRQMLQTILDAIPQRVFWKDRDSTFLGCNRPFAEDLRLDSPASIVGKNDFDFSWTGMAEQYRADDKLVMEQRSAKLNFQERQTRSDGTEFWLQTSKLPLFDPQGKVTGLVCTYEDITERRRAEWELRLTKASLEIASDTVLWIDRKARIVYANQAACRSLGFSREELTSLSIPDIDPLFPAAAWDAHWEENRQRRSCTFESQQKNKDGRVFPVEVTTNFMEFDGQEYSFAFVRDVTRRRELESQLRQAQKLESIGQLAAGIAHEINTPTQFVADNLRFLRDSWKATDKLRELYRRVIESTAELLPPPLLAAFKEAERDCDLDFLIAEAPRAIDHGLDGVQRVAKIVRAMKEFSHPGLAEKTAADLNKAIESTITVACNEWKYVADVVSELDETLSAVVCYPGDINQVILNLLVNATHAIQEKVKDGGKGRITIRTRARGEFVEISVTDTGTGIPEGIRTRIFDPFFTTKEVGKGTGQGLSLAHAVVVKKHGGKIWFESELGRGTTFFISLPINPIEQAKES